MPTLVKIDVEGAEEDVIAGLRALLQEPACRSVVCEVHFGLLAARGEPQAPVRIQETLRGWGFTSQKWVDKSHLAAHKP